MLSLKGHRNAMRRACIASVAALALIAGFGLASVMNEAQATSTTTTTTVTQCGAAFQESDASDTCELETGSVSGDDCTLSGLCRHNGVWHETSITADIDDVDDLVNCSGSLATSC